MSTLTDSDDARRECCRTVADTSAATVARLTRERDEARAQVAAVLAECDHSEWVIREASGVELAPPLVGVTTHRIRTAIADALGAPRG